MKAGTAVETTMSAVSEGAGDTWKFLKYGAWAALGLGALVAVTSIASSVRSRKDPASTYLDVIRSSRSRALLATTGGRMTWTDVKKTLTTPPPPRPPPPKYPLFTKDVFSTKSFGPGHIVGAAGLVGGLFLLTRYFVRRGQAQAAEFQQAMAKPPLPPGSPGPARPPADSRGRPDEPKVAQAQNERGEYGTKRP